MIEAQQIKAKLAAVERGDLALADFESWFDGASWNMHRDSDAASIRLAGQIHLLMADRDSGVIDAAEYAAALMALRDHHRVLSMVATVAQSPNAALVRAASNNNSRLVEWYQPAISQLSRVKVHYAGAWSVAG